MSTTLSHRRGHVRLRGLPRGRLRHRHSACAGPGQVRSGQVTGGAGPPTMAACRFPGRDPPGRTPRWIMSRPERLRPDEAVGWKEVRTACPELDPAVEHVRTFGALMQEHRGADLEGWIERVRQHHLPALRQFADGLLNGRDTVIAGLSSPWSSGQVEGQATRVKLIERAGYGRAKLDLLRTRVLLRA
ncbi:transposase [Streptomyces sp. NPDC005506]|uniref:transposase n=1 Tax=Streptomyces sp. NPDC005506 TaxID=3364718 RepID=UPI0036B350E8